VRRWGAAGLEISTCACAPASWHRRSLSWGWGWRRRAFIVRSPSVSRELETEVRMEMRMEGKECPYARMRMRMGPAYGGDVKVGRPHPRPLLRPLQSGRYPTINVVFLGRVFCTLSGKQ
jgi:hypothetical protein